MVDSDVDAASGNAPLECPVCRNIKRDTKYFICMNGHNICGDCKPRLLTCPECRGEYNNPATRNFALEQLIASINSISARNIQIQCRHKGCDFESSPRRTEKHETKRCEFRPVLCVQQCGQLVAPGDREAHKAEFHVACPLSPAHCSFNGTKTKSRAHVDRDCPFKQVSCPEPNCGHNLLRKDLSEHKTRYHTDCKFEGCIFKGTFTLLTPHERDCEFRTVKCNMCMGKVMVRETEMDEHVRSVHAPCKYAPDCTITGRKNIIREHESKCRFRPVPCPAGICITCSSEAKAHCSHGGCSEAVKERDVLAHLNEAHKSLISLSEVKTTYSCSSEAVSWPSKVMEFNGKKFFCQCRINTADNLCYVWTTLFGNSDILPNFALRVNVEGPGGNKVEYETRVFGVDDGLNEVVKSGEVTGLAKAFRRAKQDVNEFKVVFSLGFEHPTCTTNTL